jgi:hypothetical protein
MANHFSAGVRRPYLIDGYISETFGFQNAERYMALVFKVDPQTVVAALQNGAFYVFNPPSRYTSPTHLVHGENAWLVDYSVSCQASGPVVPQQIWLPQEECERKNFVENAQFRVPAFFVNRNGSLGVPISNAGHMQLRDGQLTQSLSENTQLRIRLFVCTHLLAARSPSLMLCILVARLYSHRSQNWTEGQYVPK